MMTGILGALAVLLILPIMLALFLTTEVTGVIPSLTSILEFIFGRVGLWAGAVLVLLIIVLDRRSEEHFVFGPDMVEHRLCCGPFVFGRTRFPLGWIKDPDLEEAPGGLRVNWQWRGRRGRRWMTNEEFSPADARRIESELRHWLDRPRPAASGTALPGHQDVLEGVLTVVTSRFALAVPMLLAAVALLILAHVWQIYRESPQDQAEPFEVAQGELLEMVWVIDPDSSYSQYVASVRMQATVAFEAAGKEHQLHLASRRSEPLAGFWMWYPRAVTLLGDGGVKFLVPPRLLARVPAGSGWLEWSNMLWARTEDSTPRPIGLDVLDALDDPWLYLTTRAGSLETELQVAFPPGQPERAMLLSWLDAEREARSSVFLPMLIPITVIAILLVFATLPRVLARSLHRRWIGRIAAALLILALPWWAGQAEAIPRWLNVDSLVVDLTADLLRLHAAEREHLWLVRVNPEPRSGTLLEWSLESSKAYPLLQRLGVADVVQFQQGGNWPDSETAQADIVAAATHTLAFWSVEELKRFAIDYGSNEGPQRYGDLHRQLVEPAFCLQRQRLGTGFLYERFIDLHFPCQDA
jgi:hypothetical protein